MDSGPIEFKEGDRYKIFRQGYKGELLQTITISEDCCKKTLDRMLFFKYNIPPGDYVAVKVSKRDE